MGPDNLIDRLGLDYLIILLRSQGSFSSAVICLKSLVLLSGLEYGTFGKTESFID